MSETLTVILHDIATDGLPNMDALVGRVAFIWNGAIVSGWPVSPEYGGGGDGAIWEPSEDRFGGEVWGVTQWVEFPRPVWRLATSTEEGDG